MSTKLFTFSPTATVDFARCPKLWWLKRQRIEPIQAIGRPQVATIVGRAVSWVMEQWVMREDVPESQLLEEATIAIEQEIRAWEEAGRYLNYPYKSYDTVIQSTREVFLSAMTTYLANPCLPRNEICEAEVVLDKGRARVDAVTRIPTRGIEPVDYKFKISLDDKYYQSTLDEYEESWQFYHYVNAMGEKYRKTPRAFHLILIIAKPYRAGIHTFPVRPERLEQWRKSAKYYWENMKTLADQADEDNGQSVPLSPTHSDRYGACPYKSLCLEYHGDVEMALQSNEYQHVPREYDQPNNE